MTRRPRRLLTLSVATLLTYCLPLPAEELRTLGGGSATGTLVGFTADGVQFKAKDGAAKTWPLGELLALEWVAAPDRPANLPAHTRLRLTDGTLLLAETVAYAGGTLKLKLLGGRELSVPLAAVSSLLADAQDPKNEAEFQAALEKGTKADVLRLTSRDGKSINVFQGVVGEADAAGKTLGFTPEGGDAVQLAVPRLRSIAFAQPLNADGAKWGRLHDLRGNQYALATIALADKNLKLATPTGLAFDLPLADAQRLDLAQGKLAYLSDLEPLRVDVETINFVPPKDRRIGRNQTLRGTPLTLGRKPYAKGLAVHARTILEYDVAGYQFFRCTLGLDDSVSRVGHAIVRLEGDGKELFSQAVSLRDAKPHEVEVKITGVKRLRLVVDYGEDGDLGDHVVFADARVMK